MGGVFPELKEHQNHVTAIVKDEEESFSRTLDKGLQKFKELAEKVGNDKVFSGEDAHFLYTSMGFPVDLTELMCYELDMTLDTEGFEKKMQEEKDLSAAAHQAKMSGGSGKDMRLVAEQTAYLVNQGVDATDDSEKFTWNKDLTDCKAKGLFIGRGETEDGIGFTDSISESDGAIGMILDKTSYYGESGGQIYDIGTIVSENGATMKVDNVQIYGQYVLHLGTVVEGTFRKEDTVTCSVDYERRAPIAANHTMTHVLNYALKDVLVGKAASNDAGQSVDQKGSLVDESKLRFDFSWGSGLTTDQLAAVEKIVGGVINDAIPVDAYVAPLDDAKRISSLRAVFGEVYPDPVRVVAVSPSPISEILQDPENAKWGNYSVEFCGGTHLSNTKDAQAFVLLQEEGIAKGIRRITGITMHDAQAAVKLGEELKDKVTTIGELKGLELDEAVKTLTAELNAASISAVLKSTLRDTLTSYAKKVVAWKKERAAAKTSEVTSEVIAAAESTDGNKVILRVDVGADAKSIKSVQTAVGKKIKDKAFFLVSADEDADRYIVLAFAPSSMPEIDCKAWASSAIEGTNGKGGGKKDSAQFTVSGVSSIDSVLEKAKSL
jgi:alanyl-tRNA synthetase